eukprot:5585241-Amphidinium_carterae.1
MDEIPCCNVQFPHELFPVNSSGGRFRFRSYSRTVFFGIDSKKSEWDFESHGTVLVVLVKVKCKCNCEVQVQLPTRPNSTYHASHVDVQLAHKSLDDQPKLGMSRCCHRRSGV